LLEVIDNWDDVSTKLQPGTPASGAVTDARLTTPLQFPRKVICAGANYYGHLAEMGIERPTDCPPVLLLQAAVDNSHRAG